MMAQMCIRLYEITFREHESEAGLDSQSLVSQPLVFTLPDAQGNSALVPHAQVLIVLK